MYVTFGTLVGPVLTLGLHNITGRLTVDGIPKIQIGANLPSSAVLSGTDLVLTYPLHPVAPFAIFIPVRDPAVRNSFGGYLGTAAIEIYTEPWPPTPVAGINWAAINANGFGCDIFASGGGGGMWTTTESLWVNTTTTEPATSASTGVNPMTLTFPSGVTPGDVITYTGTILQTWTDNGNVLDPGARVAT